MQEIDVHLGQYLTDRQHEVRPCARKYRSSRECLLRYHAPTLYRIVIHANTCSPSEEFKWYDCATCSENSATVPYTEHGDCSRRYILFMDADD